MSTRSVAAAFVALTTVITAVASFFAFSSQSSGTLAFWGLSVLPTVLLATVAAAWAKGEGLLDAWLRPTWGDFTRGLMGALLLFGVAWAFVRIVAPVGSPREIWLVSLYAAIGDPRRLQAHAPLVGISLVVAAIAEEVLWRGVVTQLIAYRCGSRTAWLWAAGLYALAFVPTTWALRTTADPAAGLNPVVMFAALGGGLLWGGMARVFGRLVPSIVAHALFDWAVVMMFPLWGGR
ncbi:MAG: CPBP family intramembrane metalloprotease [Myxococcota bacterium]|nr:CPBP family intramembrane metalloprotease [Myxococcota bacterium]